MPHQFMSTSYHASPCFAADGCAWWLLCQPSPHVSSATHQLLRESSFVSNLRLPQRWVAELTSHVEGRLNVTRRKTPQNNIGQPPTARSATPSTTPPVHHQRSKHAASACQLNMKHAATAPIWKTTIVT